MQLVLHIKAAEQSRGQYTATIKLNPINTGSGGGFTRPIPRDGGADQFRGIPIVGRLPTLDHAADKFSVSHDALACITSLQNQQVCHHFVDA